MTENEIKRKIKSYRFVEATKNELQQQLEELTYKTTNTNNEEVPAMTNAVHSKVEKYVITKVEKEKKKNEKQKELDEIWDMIHRSGLNEDEVNVMWCIAQGESLASYARRSRIYKSNVYKIRNRALRKIRNKQQNEGKNG